PTLPPLPPSPPFPYTTLFRSGQHTPSRRRLLRVGLGEPELHSRDVHDRGVIADARLPTEGLRIPIGHSANLFLRKPLAKEAEFHRLSRSRSTKSIARVRLVRQRKQ